MGSIRELRYTMCACDMSVASVRVMGQFMESFSSFMLQCFWPRAEAANCRRWRFALVMDASN